MSDELRDGVKALAATSANGLDWFETLYAGAAGDAARIPWANRRPNAHLVAWLEREKPRGRGVRTIVVGCGLGEDAELLARWGFEVTAFDLSPTAIDWCKRRFPGTRVKYLPGDLLNLPAEWVGAWDFVFEAYTLQALPAILRPAATAAVTSLVADEGRLLLVTRGRDSHETFNGPPWPLTQADVAAVAGDQRLRMESFEDFDDEEEPPIRRFRATFVR